MKKTLVFLFSMGLFMSFAFTVLVPRFGQCGGLGYTGSTTCENPYTCIKINDFYSQCQ